jgi:hypothetical protein
MTIRDQILSVTDRPVLQTDPVPVWGFPVYIRTFSAAEKIWLKGRVKDDTLLYSDVACVALGDEHGNRLFSNDEVEIVAEKHDKAIEFVGALALEWNHMRPEDDRAAEKNSATTPSSSGSCSSAGRGAAHSRMSATK